MTELIMTAVYMIKYNCSAVRHIYCTDRKKVIQECPNYMTNVQVLSKDRPYTMKEMQKYAHGKR